MKMASRASSGPADSQAAHEAGEQAGSARLAMDSDQADRLDRQWAALQQAGMALARLAQCDPEALPDGLPDFPARIRKACLVRRVQVAQGMDDLARIMTLGLSALEAIRKRGGDARCAARALWMEYEAARRALLALLPPARHEAAP